MTARRWRFAWAFVTAGFVAGCAAALEPRTVAFSYSPSKPPPSARISSYADASAAIAGAFAQDLGFPPFTATLHLYPDARSFEAALVAVGYDPPFARETARVMSGIGGHRRVLLNEEALLPLSWPARVALLAHELTHTLQYELGGGRRGASDQWLREGLAEWVSMRVLERLRAMTPDDYRSRKLRHLRGTRAAEAPRLNDMATFQQLVRLAARDDIAPYEQSFVAVDMLIERHGLPAVVRYFTMFATSDDRAGNFVASFGLDLETFEAAVLNRVWPRRRGGR
jgi:hypothetical protein